MKPEKSKSIGILDGNLFVFVIVMGMLLTLLAVPGCDEAGQMMAPVIDNEPADTVPPVMVGDMKEDPGEKPAEPATIEPDESDAAKEEPTEQTPPADTESPTVVEVGFYRDWQLTRAITMTDTVRPGDTIFSKVVFSEPVRHSVADDESARPALSFVLDGQATRFRVAAHGAHGEDFLSGDCKPLHDGTDDYICKVTLPADIVGTLALEVGTETADAAGNPAAATVHTAPFMVEMEPVGPEPVEEKPMEEIPPVSEEPTGLELIDTLDWLTPPPNTVLSANEQALIDSDASLGRDGTAQILQTQVIKAADRISLLPYKDREEVYEQFVAVVNLPFFAEAAGVLKERNIQLRTLGGEASRTGDWDLYQQFRSDSDAELGITVDIKLTLARIYFRENPQDAPHEDVHSFYWILLEYYRLQLEHPDLATTQEGGGQESLLILYRQSARKGHIFGLDNPWG